MIASVFVHSVGSVASYELMFCNRTDSSLVTSFERKALEHCLYFHIPRLPGGFVIFFKPLSLHATPWLSVEVMTGKIVLTLVLSRAAAVLLL